MKKLLVVLAMTVSLTGVSIAGDNGLYGGFFHFGGAFMMNPQPGLNTVLEGYGYESMTYMNGGMLWGGGSLVNNFFIGGWGTFGFGGPTSESLTANKTVMYNMGMGGCEFGYAVVNTDVLTLIPSVSLLWGGGGLEYRTNMNFNDFVDEPIEYDPSLNLSHFSIGVGLNTIFMPEHAGIYVKVVYAYGVNTSWGPALFSNAPEIGKHSIIASVGMTFGGIGTKVELEEDYDEVPEKEQE